MFFFKVKLIPTVTLIYMNQQKVSLSHTWAPYFLNNCQWILSWLLKKSVCGNSK